MFCSRFVATKSPFSFSGRIVLFLFSLFSLFFSLSSNLIEASDAASSSFKSLQTRFHTNSLLTTCAAPHISSLSCQIAPWFSNEFTELVLTPSFTSDCADYSVTRLHADAYSVLRVFVGATVEIDAKVTFVLNGKVIVGLSGPIIDLFLYAGINTFEVHVALGTCIRVYKINIYVAAIVVGEVVPIFPVCSLCPPTIIDSLSLSLSAAASTSLVPVVCNPLGSHDFVAYGGVAIFVGGKIHLKLNFKLGLWVRISINHGIWAYVAVSGLEIVGPVVAGTNLILFDVIQPGPCGYEIIEYCITIYPTPTPVLSSTGTGPVVVPTPTPVPSSTGHAPSICLPVALISLDLKAYLAVSILDLLQLSVVIKADVFDYVVIKPLLAIGVKVKIVVDIDVIVNAYWNGLIVSPHPVPAGSVLDVKLAAGTNVLRFDLIKGSCITHYTCTFQ
jgi:hypothetical protein